MFEAFGNWDTHDDLRVSTIWCDVELIYIKSKLISLN